MRPFALLVASALTTACAPAPPRPDPSSLARLFPAHAAEVTGFERSRAPSLHVTLPSRGEDPIRLETARGFALAVRELGAAGEGVIDGAAVAYARPHGTSWWRPSGEGVEE